MEGRSVVYFDLKDYSKALSDLTTAYKLDPTLDLSYNFAIIYFELREYKECAEYCNEYLRLNGDKYGDADLIRKMIKEIGYEPEY